MFELLAAATAPDPYWQVFGRLHPLLVHFPVALILLGALVEVFCWLTGRRETVSPTGSVCLWVGLFGGALAAWAGWTLADHQNDGGDLVSLHRWITIAGVIVLALAAAAWVQRRRKGPEWAAAHIGLFCISAILIAIGGHFGGDMVWGKGWVFEPLEQAAQAEDKDKDKDKAPVAETANAASSPTLVTTTDSVNWAQVQGILEVHCGDCHGPDRQKAGVQVVPWRALFPDDRAFWVVQPGDSATSLMHERIMLPRDADGAMPPPGKAEELTQAQIETITTWITDGAHGPDDAVPGGGETSAQDQAHDEAPEPPSIDEVQAPSLDETTVAAGVQAVRSANGVAMPVSTSSPWIDVSFAQARDKATDASLDAMSEIAPLIVRLDLSRTAVTDAGMTTVAGCTNLRVLELDHTAVADAGVADLVHLEHLARLNLYGSAVTDAVAGSLESMSALRKVYLGGTSVSAEAIEALGKARPDLQVHGDATLAEPPEKAPERVEDPAQPEAAPEREPAADPDTPEQAPEDTPESPDPGAGP